MGLAEIKNDVKLNSARLRAMDLTKMDRAALASFVQVELAENVWPFLEGLIDNTQDEMKVLEESVAELDEAVAAIEGVEQETLFPETTQQIMGLLQLGHEITVQLAPVIRAAKMDAGKRKNLVAMIRAYRQGAAVVSEMLVAITVKPEAEGPPDPTAHNAAEAEQELEDDAAAIDGDDDADGDEPEDDGLDAGGEG